MEASDYISLISVLVTVSLSVYVIFFNLRRRKVETLLHMHSLWSSEFYRRARVEAYGGVASSKKEKFVYSEDIANSALEFNLGTVEHFFGDLCHLLKADEVDRPLCVKLFKPTVDAYFSSVFSKIVYDIEAEEHYFARDVAPLKDLLS